MKTSHLYAFIGQLNQKIVREKDKTKLFRNACKMAVEFGKFKMAWVGLFDADAQKISLVNECCIPEEIASILLDFSYKKHRPQGQVLSTGKYFVCNDIAKEPEMGQWVSLAAKYGIRSLMVLPLKRGGETIGTLNLYSTELNFSGAGEIKLMVEIASDISFALDLFENEKQHQQAVEEIKASEMLYHSLFDYMLEGFAHCKMIYENGQPVDFIYLNVNQVFEKFSGLKNVIGKKITELIPNIREDNPELILTYSRVALSGKPERFEIYVKALEIWYDVMVFSTEKGYFTAVFDVITERKGIERQREFDKNNLDALINNTQDLLWSVDKDLRLITANKAFDEMCVANFGRVIEKGVSVLSVSYSPEMFSHYKQLYERALAGESFTHTDHYDTPSEMWVEISYYPIREGGKVVGIACDSRDVTQLKKSEEVLTKFVRELSDYKFALDESSIVAITDQTGIIRYANNNFCKISQFTEQELLGQDHRIVNSGYHSKAFFRNLWRTIASGKIWRDEIRNKAKDGTFYWVDTVIVPFLNEHGKPYQYLSIRIDITNRKNAESKLAEANESLQSSYRQQSNILNALPSSIALLDKKGTILAVNEAWKQFADDNDLQSKSYCLGDNYLEVSESATGSDKEFGREMAEGIINVLKGRKNKFEMVYPCHSPDKNRWFKALVRPLAEGKNSEVVVMHIDITQQKEAQDNVVSMNSELEKRVSERTAELREANKALEAFSYSASHDLRSPVRAVMGFAKIINKQFGAGMSVKEKELFGYIEDSGNRMNAIIDDLLSLAKWGKEKLQVSEVDMTALFTRVWNNSLVESPHQAILELSPLLIVRADSAMIGHVVTNLISNAVKYSSKKEKPLVKVGYEELNGEVIFHVNDNGAGFDMKYYDRLFGAFRRLHGIDEFEGTGIGLALIKTIIEKHKGRVWAEGKVGEGATFYFSLPR